eukprot:3547446-Amphidinium_carterae.2
MQGSPMILILSHASASAKWTKLGHLVRAAQHQTTRTKPRPKRDPSEPCRAFHHPRSSNFGLDLIAQGNLFWQQVNAQTICSLVTPPDMF